MAYCYHRRSMDDILMASGTAYVLHNFDISRWDQRISPECLCIVSFRPRVLDFQSGVRRSRYPVNHDVPMLVILQSGSGSDYVSGP